MKEKRLIFTDRQLFQLLWPLLAEQFLTMFVGMVDVVMVASIGEIAVSGVSLVDALNQLIIQFLGALSAGGTVVCAQYIGMRNKEKTRQSSGQLFLITLTAAIGVVLVLLIGGRQLLMLMFGKVEPEVMNQAYQYFIITIFSFPFLALYNSGAALFRAVGNSRISMKVSLFMNALNIAGNALCIYVLHMGVSGVAIPTLISRVLAAGLIIYLLCRPNVTVGVKSLNDLKPQFHIIQRILGIGIPGGIESSLFQLGKVMLSSLVSTLGTASIAGYAVAGNLVTFLYMPGFALGIGLTTVVGQCVGAGEFRQAKDYIKKFILLDYLLLAVIASILGFGRYFFIGIYHISPEATAIASVLLASHCLCMLIWPVAFVTPYGIRAANDAKFTMITSTIATWVFRVVLAYIFVKVFHLGIIYVWIAMYIDWIYRNIVYLMRMRKFEERASQTMR